MMMMQSKFRSTYISIGISQEVEIGKSDDDKNRFTVTLFGNFRGLKPKMLKIEPEIGTLFST